MVGTLRFAHPTRVTTTAFDNQSPLGGAKGCTIS
jgi:hypothetical protein